MSTTGQAYDAAAPLWRRGPEAVYARLADAMLDLTPVDLAGAAVLDVGAGTGVVARAARRRGAGTVVASDLSAAMLATSGPGLLPVVADGLQLPFATGSFDLVTAACCLSHLPDPVTGLVEMSRAGTSVLATSFAPVARQPVKDVVDQVLAGYGFVVPEWYRHLKEVLEPRVNDAAGLAGMARAAGVETFRVDQVEVDVGLDSAEAIANWRLGMAHLAPFVARLPQAARDAARAAAVDAVAAAGGGQEPVVVALLVLTAA